MGSFKKSFQVFGSVVNVILGKDLNHPMEANPENYLSTIRII